MWKPNRVNHQYFLLLQNCYLQIVFPAVIDKDGITPYLPIPIGRRLRPPGLSATTERMPQQPIYQCQLEGGYDPLVLSATTERMLRHPVLSATTNKMLLHPIYQLLLEGGNKPLHACFLP